MRFVTVAPVLCTLVLLSGGCGSDRHAATTTTRAAIDHAAALAEGAKIERRLTAAGYAVRPAPILSGADSSPGPNPIKSFQVKIDSATKHGFTFFAIVFATPAIAGGAVREAQAECNATPACRRYSQKANRSYQQEAVGAVVYSATSDSGVSAVSAKTFDRLVAIATGRA